MKWLFWGAFALIAYTYAGYPLWLWLRRSFRPWPIQRGAIDPFVSVLMVVRNEEKVLAEKLDNLLGLDYPAERLQIVVVSDGSTDGTEQILHAYARDPRVQVLLNQLSTGKASGLNDALHVAQGEIVVFTDARQKLEAGALKALLADFADPSVGCASGELMLGDPNSGEAVQGMGMYWRMEKKIRELESASGSVVGATGALYAARHESIAAIPSETLLDDVLIPMNVVRSGKRVVFEPEARAWDIAHQGNEREFARKVRTLSGNYQLLQLAPWLLSSGNPIRFEFISHKLLRLWVPFGLLICLCSSALLPGPFYRTVLAVQVAFYALSFVGMAHMKTGLFSRLGDAAHTFVVLNTAALVAFANFVSGRKAAWTR
jgi:biofilm PGA synthesis N-glycosyltransferase PgaC